MPRKTAAEVLWDIEDSRNWSDRPTAEDAGERIIEELKAAGYVVVAQQDASHPRRISREEILTGLKWLYSEYGWGTVIDLLIEVRGDERDAGLPTAQDVRGILSPEQGVKT